MESYEVKFIEFNEVLYTTIVRAKKQALAITKAAAKMESETGISEFSKVEVKYIPKRLL
ncbi:hypothetical protein [Paenibacillus sp. ISL-20]|uniref:hypothetical protein n=1 Tax=Paenibacillus sp. ISL-20 TaxID=2819163 RepID=UPI001BE9A49E|nr:hypothetical protein [Paenibacillus sp. ISL-20]